MASDSAPTQPAAGSDSPANGRASWLRSVKAVAWSLLGLRKGSEYAQDLSRIYPLHVIVVGLVAVFLLVIGLMMLVNTIV
ncbi:DUF2970 domain-containing protein [Acidovorax lacteus]|uniref:DUF2970 domain-containing protein n=1 Tax=Acidovorax lacteus TaxID=1924988 RepID=UPI0031E6753F